MLFPPFACDIIGNSTYYFDPTFDNDLLNFDPTVSAPSSSVSCPNLAVLDLEESYEDIKDDVMMLNLKPGSQFSHLGFISEKKKGFRLIDSLIISVCIKSRFIVYPNAGTNEPCHNGILLHCANAYNSFYTTYVALILGHKL